MNDGISPSELCDCDALEIAARYLVGDIDWRPAEATMTPLHDRVYQEYVPGLSDFACVVRSASVLGDHRHDEQPVHAAVD